MEGHGIRRIEAAAVHDPGDLCLVADLEGQLAGGFHAGEDVKGHIEGLFEKSRKDLGELPALGDDLDIVGGEAVAVQQDAEALRQGAAGLLGKDPANFCLCGAGK